MELVFEYTFSFQPRNIKPFKPIVAFHIESSHLICRANQEMTGFYMKSSTGLKWVERPFALGCLLKLATLRVKVRSKYL